MILNFIKLFPKSCEKAGIKTLLVNIDDISYVKQLEKPKIGFQGTNIFEDIIQIGNTTLRFESVDDGVAILNTIISSKNLLSEFEIAKENLTADKLAFMEKKQKICRGYISECIIKYGSDFEM